MLFLIPFCHGELLINIDSDCFDYRYVFVIVVIGNKNGCFFFTWLLCRSGTESLKLNVLEIIIFRDVVFGLMGKIFLRDFNDMISLMIYDDV